VTSNLWGKDLKAKRGSTLSCRSSHNGKRGGGGIVKRQSKRDQKMACLWNTIHGQTAPSLIEKSDLR